MQDGDGDEPLQLGQTDMMALSPLPPGDKCLSKAVEKITASEQGAITSLLEYLVVMGASGCAVTGPGPTQNDGLGFRLNSYKGHVQGAWEKLRIAAPQVQLLDAWEKFFDPSHGAHFYVGLQVMIAWVLVESGVVTECDTGQRGAWTIARKMKIALEEVEGSDGGEGWRTQDSSVLKERVRRVWEARFGCKPPAPPDGGASGVPNGVDESWGEAIARGVRAMVENDGIPRRGAPPDKLYNIVFRPRDDERGPLRLTQGTHGTPTKVEVRALKSDSPLTHPCPPLLDDSLIPGTHACPLVHQGPNLPFPLTFPPKEPTTEPAVEGDEPSVGGEQVCICICLWLGDPKCTYLGYPYHPMTPPSMADYPKNPCPLCTYPKALTFLPP